jgi:hypothetical protein
VVPKGTAGGPYDFTTVATGVGVGPTSSTVKTLSIVSKVVAGDTCGAGASPCGPRLTCPTNPCKSGDTATVAGAFQLSDVNHFPSRSVALTLDSGVVPGLAPGSPSSDANGVVSFTFTLPAAGSHVISAKVPTVVGDGFISEITDIEWLIGFSTIAGGDTTGPVGSAATAAPHGLDGVALASTEVSFKATDALNAVSIAEYYIGSDPGAGSGTPMTVVDGVADELSEDFKATVTHASLAVYDPGVSIPVYMRAKDVSNNWGTPVLTNLIKVVSSGASPDPVVKDAAIPSSGSAAIVSNIVGTGGKLFLTEYGTGLITPPEVDTVHVYLEITSTDPVFGATPNCITVTYNFGGIMGAESQALSVLHWSALSGMWEEVSGLVRDDNAQTLTFTVGPLGSIYSVVGTPTGGATGGKTMSAPALDFLSVAAILAIGVLAAIFFISQQPAKRKKG